MKKYFIFNPNDLFFAEVTLESSGSVNPATTPSTILGQLIASVKPIASTSTNSTSYNALVAAFVAGAYSSEAALIAFASTTYDLYVLNGYDKAPIQLVNNAAA